MPRRRAFLERIHNMFEWLNDSNALIERLLRLALFIPCITVHEFAHARTAQGFGDDTARNMGRCTLNPLAHLDLLGTICMFLGIFGWAKPVPVNPMNLRPQRMGNIMVSLAGPMSNVGMALFTGLTLRAIYAHYNNEELLANPALMWTATCLYYMFAINIILAVFNMIPLFPLDGHHILREMIPAQYQMGFMHWQVRYGMMALLAIVFLPGFLPGNQMDPVSYLYHHALSIAQNLIIYPHLRSAS